MNEILPDGGKPIQVGDPSFIYNGVYHPIYWDGLDPYRPRVEMLVVSDGCKVYLRMYDKSPEFDYQYRIPGGSIDNDSTKLDQAIAETNEEGLLSVSDAQYSNVQYYELYKPNFVLKGGDMPLSYKGSINDVFVAKYNGPYDKKKVEVKDLDDDMAKNGKFYWIDQVADKLRPEHRQALINCPFINGAMKRMLRQCELPELTKTGAISNTFYYIDYPLADPKTVAVPTSPPTYHKDYKSATSLKIGDHPTSARVPCYKDLNVAVTAFMHYHPSYHGAIAVYEVDPLETDKIITTSGAPFDEYWSLNPIRIIWSGDAVSVPTDSFVYEKNVNGYKLRETITNRKILSWSKRNRMIQDKVVTEGTTTIPIPGGLLYHASTTKIDSFRPMSLDLGNEINPPGWSTFCFADKQLAKRFGIMRAIQKLGISCGWYMQTNQPYLLEKDYNTLQNFSCIVFYIHTIDPEYCDVTAGNDSRFPEFIFRNNGVIPKDVDGIAVPVYSIKEFVTILQKEPSFNANPNVNSYYAAMLNHDYSQSDYVVSKLENAIKVGKLKPGDDVEKFMRMNHIEFDKDSFIKSFSNVSSVEEALSFSSYKRVPLTNGIIKQLQSKYPQLKHVRTGPMCKGYVWLDDDKIVAYLNTEEKSDANDVWIQALEVMPDYRGNRFAERMLRVATDELHATKLSVNVKNEKAIKIYKNNGFRIFKEDSTMYYMTTSSAAMEGAVAENIPANVRELYSTLNGYQYGVLINGKIMDSSKVNFARDYRTISITDMDKYHGGGVCWDFVNYEAEWFRSNGYPYTTYMVLFGNKSKLLGTHTFLIFSYNDSYYWFESSWGDQQQIRAFTSEKEAVAHVLYLLKTSYRATEYELYQYNAGKEYIGLSNKEFFDTIKRKGKRLTYKPKYVRESVLDVSILEEKYPDLDDDDFGVPNKRKFPLDTKGHVTSAIRFFNYVDKDDEEELARRLIKRMKETGLYGTVKIGKKNRLYSYLEGTIPQFGSNARYAVSTHKNKIPTSPMFQSTLALAIRANHCENGSYFAFAQVGNKIYPMGEFIFRFTNPNEYQYEIEWIDSSNSKKTMIEGMTDLSTSLVYTGLYDPRRLSTVMEAPGDEEERPKTPIDDDSPTDYGDNAEEDEEEDRPPTPIDDDEPTDYDDPSGEGDDNQDDAGNTDDNSEDGDTTADATSDGNSNNNNLVKNYSLMLDFEKLFAFVEDVGNTLESTLKAVPVQNKVLIQVSRNLTTIQNFIKEFIQFYFKADDFQFNLYYYEVIIQALKLNLSMIEEINEVES